jgi:hypothetical protein
MVSGMTDFAARSAHDPATDDLTLALSIAVGAIVLGSFLPWSRDVFVSVRGTDGAGNLTLLLGGIAGALTARWRLGGSAHRSLMTASVLLCATASAVSLDNLVRVMRSAQPQGGLFVATAGAFAATGLAVVLRRRTQTVCSVTAT